MNPEIKTIYSTFNKNLYRITGEGGISDTLNSNNFANTTGYLEVPADSVGAGVSVSQIDNVGATRFQNVIIGGNTIVISNTDDIQRSIYALGEDGGVVHLKAGTYSVPSGGIVLPSSCRLEGDSYKNTIIDFTGGGTGVSSVGGTAYTTGTITSITSGVLVTGSGTSWLANVSAGQHLFLGTRWYKIAAVTSDTTLVLSEGYGDSLAMPGLAYQIATIIQDISITDLTIKNATGSGITITRARDMEFVDVYTMTNSVDGFTMTDTMGLTTQRLYCIGNTGYGFKATNSGFGDWTSIPCISNTAGGMYLDNLKTIPIYASASDANTGNGYTFTNCNDVTAIIEAAGNGGKGVEFVSANNNIVFVAALISGNTSDGIKLTATTDNFKIGGSHVVNNGGYGINIAASTDDNTVISGNDFSNNSSGAVNDSGTGTIISGNAGIADNAKLLIVPTVDGVATGPTTNSFVSGYTSSAVGDLVYLDSSSKWQKVDCDSDTTSTGLLGIALSVAATDATLLVALHGAMVYSTAFPAMTVGAVMYASETPGEISASQPTGTDGVIRVIGYAIHADKIMFLPSSDWITIV